MHKWDGSVYKIENNTKTEICTGIEPVLAIHTVDNNVMYIGYVHGDVYRIVKNDKKIVMKTEGSVVCDGCNVSAVVGIHTYQNILVVLYMHGEIVLYNTTDRTKIKTVRSSGTIINSILKLSF